MLLHCVHVGLFNTIGTWNMYLLGVLNEFLHQEKKSRSLESRSGVLELVTKFNI
jgi:hypothetical protein